MANKPKFFRPQILSLIIILAQFITLLVLLRPVFSPSVFLLFLLISLSVTIRWRFNIKPVYMIIDQIVFIIISIFYPHAILISFIIVYYLSYHNKLIYSLPIIIVGLFFDKLGLYIILNVQAIMFGLIIHYWQLESKQGIEASDNLRQRIYDLEIIQTNLLKDYQDTERVAMLTERQRIAEILHDDLGHELTAAHLALKAYKALLNQDKKVLATQTFEKAETRLNNALQRLKESVRNIEPQNEFGFNNVSKMIDNFSYPIIFNHSGDINRVNPYLWQLIQGILKEALTNILKHAMPNKINIDLEVTNHVIRLIIENDGILSNNTLQGNGLRYMRNRLEAINGSLSIQKDAYFRLVIIIPLGEVK